MVAIWLKLDIFYVELPGRLGFQALDPAVRFVL